MAIKKYVGDHYYNLTNFYNWLNENKAGTFLENMTIALTSASNSGSTLTISSENCTLTYRTAYATTSEVDVISLNGIYGNWSQVYPGYSGTTGTRFNSILLCTNGVIFAVESYAGSSNFPTNYFVVTVDSNGEIAFVSSSGNINVSSITGYKVAVYDSTTTPTVTLTPEYNSTLTSLSPVVPTTGDNSIKLPYAFAALHTQFTDRGLSAVAIGGDNYITNGYWYVKD